MEDKRILLYELYDKYEACKNLFAPSFAGIYEKHFYSRRLESLNILEIGIAEGGSIRAMKEYFPNSQFYGIESNVDSAIEEDRIKTFVGYQGDSQFLKHVMKEIENVDIVIDDGSHFTRELLYPLKIYFRS